MLKCVSNVSSFWKGSRQHVKVLFFNTLSAVNGGAERSLFDTSIELIERDHEISLVVAYDDRRTRHTESWPGEINRYYIPELIRPVTDRRAFDAFRRSAFYQNGLRYAQDIIDIEAPDVIHVHNFPSVEVFADLRINVPMVRTIHAYENVCQSKTKRLPDGSICTQAMGNVCHELCGFEDSFAAVRVRAEDRFMKSYFKRLLPVSHYVQDVLLQNGFGQDQLRVLGNFTRMRGAIPAADEEDLVLFVGRMTPEKGLLELVQAVGRTHSNPTLLAVGTDSALWSRADQAEINREAENWGVRLETQGWSSPRELRSAYSRAKVVAFSSVWPEPFGLVGIEAMAHGKPVVAFDGGGVADWLEHGRTGYLVARSDVMAFARCLDLLLADRGLRRRMGERAVRVVCDRFSPDHYVERLMKVYGEVIDESTSYRSRRCPAVRHAQRGTGLSV